MTFCMSEEFLKILQFRIYYFMLGGSKILGLFGFVVWKATPGCAEADSSSWLSPISTQGIIYGPKDHTKTGFI